MSDWIDRRTRIWASIAIVCGVVFYLALEISEEPEMSAAAIAIEFVKVLPVVLMSVGVVLLFKVTARQRDEQLTLMRDLEVSLSRGCRVSAGAPNRDRC
jgi:hypothetical protein